MGCRSLWYIQCLPCRCWPTDGLRVEKDETEEEVYYTIYNRHDKFPQGESLDDLALRAERALDETVWPCLETALQKATPETEEAHIVIVSHGLAISEMVSARACQFLLLPAFRSKILSMQSSEEALFLRLPAQTIEDSQTPGGRKSR